MKRMIGGAVLSLFIFSSLMLNIHLLEKLQLKEKELRWCREHLRDESMRLQRCRKGYRR